MFVSEWILDSKNKKKFIDVSQQLDFFIIVAVWEEKDGTIIKLENQPAQVSGEGGALEE